MLIPYGNNISLSYVARGSLTAFCYIEPNHTLFMRLAGAGRPPDNILIFQLYGKEKRLQIFVTYELEKNQRPIIILYMPILRGQEFEALEMGQELPEEVRRKEKMEHIVVHSLRYWPLSPFGGDPPNNVVVGSAEL